MITERSAQIAIHVLQGYSHSQVARIFEVSPQWTRDCLSHCCRKVAYDVWEQGMYIEGKPKLKFIRRHRFTLMRLLKDSLEQHGGV